MMRLRVVFGMPLAMMRTLAWSSSASQSTANVWDTTALVYTDGINVDELKRDEHA